MPFNIHLMILQRTETSKIKLIIQPKRFLVVFLEMIKNAVCSPTGRELWRVEEKLSTRFRSGCAAAGASLEVGHRLAALVG